MDMRKLVGRNVKRVREKTGLTQEKVLATVVSLMERTNIRVGNNIYEKLYGSFGLTTLKDKHVEFKGGSVKFSFVGKKGVKHDISLKNKKLISLYKCFALLKNRITDIKNLLFNTNEKLKEWLTKMFEYFSIYGLKENKKGRKNITEILGYNQQNTN